MDNPIAALTNELRLRGFAYGTIQQYASAVQRLLGAYPGLPVNDLTEAHIKDFLLLCLDDGRKASSIRVLVAAFRFFFNHVLHRPEVVEHVAFPKQAKRLPSAPSHDEVARILHAAQEISLRAWLVCALAYGCGLRISEIASLHSADIRSKEGFLFVREGKGTKDRNTLLPIEVLHGLRRWWKQERLSNPSYLFLGEKEGHFISPATLRGDFHRAVKRAGICRTVRLHDLRHGFVTHLVQAKVDVFTIQQLAGHEDLNTTQTYVLVDASRFRDIGSLIGSLPAVAA